jgi:acyl-CoA synthetase (AMP-forming)/AMP-acid ligase II
VVVSWLPLNHDMGLIGMLLQPLYVGFHAVLMSPLHFAQRPVRWLEAISRFHATTSGAPNFAYDLCVRKTTPERRETLDLTSWDLAYSGSEPVCHDTIDAFARAFADCGFRRESFYPCYGLAEATLIVSGGRKRDPPVIRDFSARGLEEHRVMPAGDGDLVRRLVGCGRTMPGEEILIVDPDSRRPCSDAEVGEIWVRGPNVAQGYWSQPEETRRVFRAQLADSGDGPFLRTGDLGFLRDGELFIVARVKDLIIIDGRNHSPQDIERTVEACIPQLRPSGCAAFSVEVDGRERLVIVGELQPVRRPRALVGTPDGDGVAAPEITAAIRRVVAEQHDVGVHAVHLVKVGAIPKTSSGKVQRRACRARFLADALEAAW